MMTVFSEDVSYGSRSGQARSIWAMVGTIGM